MGLFWRQFMVLCWKNWIVLSKHPFLNLIRCFIMPVAYGVFLATAQEFLLKPNNYGLGSPIPIAPLTAYYDGSSRLLWADGTNTSNPFLAPEQIMSRIASNFDSRQHHALQHVESPDDIAPACPQNFNLFSECFGAVVFNALPQSAEDPTSVNYTIRADGGLYHIDVTGGKSDFEKRILPLQFALDQAITELRTGVTLATPLEWPFTRETNEQQATQIRLSYIRGLRTLLVIALFICFVGISYQLPGAVMGERANLVTSHMKAMGLLDSARVLSWHVTHSLAYLPAWVIVALIWHYRIFTATSAVLVLVVHLLLGLSLASYGIAVGAPFGKSPQLAAVASTFGAIVAAIIALVFSQAGTGAAVIFSLIFPPAFYVFAIRAMCGWENHQLATDALRGDPDSGLMLLPLLIIALINIFLWPYLGALLERRLYDARDAGSSWNPFRRRARVQVAPELPPDTAISVRNLERTFKRRGKPLVTAVGDLTLDIPRHGIFVLLGSNGAGKSTTLSILGGLLGRTGGSVTFADAAKPGGRPPPGHVGIVPQKNVLFPELTCLQNLRVWRAVKRPSDEAQDEDLVQLLKDCDLEKKIHANASTLSGGQKRKLQLAIGLVGGSKIVLVDECTSGVDPLSRRALWRTLISVREERTIVFTTHFLDEADLLGDQIAVLAAPGKLVAQGTPVALKSTLGEGYALRISYGPNLQRHERAQVSATLLERLRGVAPSTTTAAGETSSETVFHLKTKDASIVRSALVIVDEPDFSASIASYHVQGASIEGIFLDLMAAESGTPEEEKTAEPEKVQEEELKSPGHDSLPSDADVPQLAPALNLTDGRSKSPLVQTFTIFHKRMLIARRSWLIPLIAILVAVCGACIPLVFLTDREQSCVRRFVPSYAEPLYLPFSPITFSVQDPNPNVTTPVDPSSQVYVSPPGVLHSLGPSVQNLSTADVSDNATFLNTIKSNYRNLMLGGVSFDFAHNTSLFAWEASAPGDTGPTMLTLISNVLYNRAINASGTATVPHLITPYYEAFPPVAAGTLVALKWVAFFGAALAVYPAFFAIYVSKERRSSVQAMQLSNGLSNPAGLWLGHLMFDAMFSVFAMTVIIIVFATTATQFHGLGFFWVVLVLYGLASTLFAYCMSLFVASPLAAFAATAGYQIILYILYLAAYLLVLTYAKTSAANSDITTIHFTMSLLSPVPSMMRAAFVSVNLFSLLCTGNEPVGTSALGDIMRYGGPITYLIFYIFFLFGVLVWYDSGSILPRNFRKARTKDSGTTATANAVISRPDVEAEARAVAQSEDALRVMRVSKTFEGKTVVDDVSFAVSTGTILSLLGPNGAGKTTTFNMVRGDIIPTTGQILIQGKSAVSQPRAARLHLGVCPQFTAIDAQLTVREHLDVYGRLKGLNPGPELRSNVDQILKAAGLESYRDREASRLSGGNQRKLALAIALMGNPSVVLIDEFSSGVDARMKREMWTTLRSVSAGKAVVITTHSMEEASALSNKVAILAKKMLAVGTTAELEARYARYEVHFACRTPAEVLRAREAMARVPGARAADDVATRFEVPIVRAGAEDGCTLADLFGVLAAQEGLEYTVERPTLESVFLKVIREHNVEEEDDERRKVGMWTLLRRML